MSTDAPTATVTIAGQSRTVRFDYDRLVAIEASTGLTLLQTLSEFSAYGAARPDGAEPTDAQMQAAAERFSVTFVGKFVAGCLGVPPADLGKTVPLGEFRPVFTVLLPGFVEAVHQLHGIPMPGAAADPTKAPTMTESPAAAASGV